MAPNMKQFLYFVFTAISLLSSLYVPPKLIIYVIFRIGATLSARLFPLREWALHIR